MEPKKTIIDVQNWNLIIEVLEETVHFKVFNYSPIPSIFIIDECFNIDSIDRLIHKTFM